MSRIPFPSGARGVAVWVAGVLVGLYLLLMAVSYIDPTFAGDDVPRGVELAGEPIGGFDDPELSDTVSELSDRFAESEVQIGDGPDAVTLSAAELGMSVDEAATLAAAHDGADPFVLVRPFAYVTSFFSERQVDARIDLDEAALASAVTDLELPGVTAAREPTLEGDGDGVRVVSGTTGSGVDTAALAEALREEATAGAPGEAIQVDPPLVDVSPRVSEEEAEAAAAAAEEATVAPLEVQIGEAQRALEPHTLRSWVVLVVEGDDEDPRVDWGLDEGAAADALAELLGDVGSPGTAVGFTVEAGQVRTVAGEAPTRCCADDSVDRIESALRTGADSVALDLVPGELERDQEWAESLGIVEPVASFTTTHSCCQNRVTNIHLIADATRGVVIEPGETFSLNGHVGPRTAEKGYLPAGGITHGVLVDQLGGGISQYTTTLFNAAFFAGLDFGEYQAHSIYFSRYPYGREATLSHPHPDLEIRNTTPYGVLIWSEYTDTEITVTLYSTRHVDVEQTGQTTSMQGVCTRVRTERTRRYHDGRVEVDSVGALYRRQEGENCSGESSVPTTTAPPAPPPPPPPPEEPPPPPPPPAEEPPPEGA